MSNVKYDFYLQKFPIGGVIQPIINIERYFEGAKYSSLKGIDNYGKIKDIYTETYPESSELRVWIPEIITRDNPEIELTLYFVGVNRRSVYHQFVQYISGSKLYYWDNCRNRKVAILLTEPVEPSDDELYGSTPYITASFKFTNLDGQSEQSI